jgi:metal transporter CNNM
MAKLTAVIHLLGVIICQSSPSEPSSHSIEDRLRKRRTHLDETTSRDELSNVVFLVKNPDGEELLCHPTSDRFEPYLPKCESTTYSDSTQTTGRRLHKKLYKDKSDWFFIANGICAFVCVAVAALAAGLTMGLMSLDPMTLLIKMRAAVSEQERLEAATVLPLVKQHHRLLVTLLLLNSLANEALPLFLDKLVPSWAAVVCSVTLVLFFGEIIPSAVFTGPNQVSIASKLAPLVKFVMLVLSPVASPIARLLDKFLHEDEEGSFYNRGELTALVRIQHEERMAAKKRQRAHKHLLSDHIELDGLLEAVEIAERKQKEAVQALVTAAATTAEATEFSALLGLTTQSEYSSIRSLPSLSDYIHEDEVGIVEGALQMKTKTAMDILTPINQMFAIPYNMVLKKDNMVKIYRSGYSRVPVYDEDREKEKDQTAIRGVFLTKHLIVVNSKHKRIINSLPLQIPDCVSPKINLVELMNIFQVGRNGTRGGHMALVCTKPTLAHNALEDGKAIPKECGFIGIVTLEDVIEELLQQEIYDEMDGREKRARHLAQWTLKKWRALVRRNRARTVR